MPAGGQCAIQEPVRRTVDIDTARLRLRPYRDEDVDALHRLWMEPDVRRYLWDDEVIDRATAAAAVHSSIACTQAHGFGQWAMRLLTADEVIGFCGFRWLDDGADVELLYGLVSQLWGCGLATEAVRAVLRFGFDAIGFARVLAITDVDNRASIAMMQRVGMELESRFALGMRPHVRYVLVREAFRRRPTRDEHR
jgi:ribosomal-protein-alanine N-acetyltransferase